MSVTGAIVPKGAGAVMASRRSPLDGLDFFPTPPWATRALCEHILLPRFPGLGSLMVWEPAAGEGHMAGPLGEYFGAVEASDIHDYGKGYGVGSFLPAMDRYPAPSLTDFIVTNPPFRLAQEFAEEALKTARVGVALLLRSVFIESAARYRFFRKHPLTIFAPFAERVAMTEGRWEPKATTATSYAWFVWLYPFPPKTELAIIPPGRKQALTKPDDAVRFAKPRQT